MAYNDTKNSQFRKLLEVEYENAINEMHSRCIFQEDQEHFILCKHASNIRNYFIAELSEKFKKVKNHNKDAEKVAIIVDNIEKYFSSKMMS